MLANNPHWSLEDSESEITAVVLSNVIHTFWVTGWGSACPARLVSHFTASKSTAGLYPACFFLPVLLDEAAWDTFPWLGGHGAAVTGEWVGYKTVLN